MNRRLSAAALGLVLAIAAVAAAPQPPPGEQELPVAVVSAPAVLVNFDVVPATQLAAAVVAGERVVQEYRLAQLTPSAPRVIVPRDSLARCSEPPAWLHFRPKGMDWRQPIHHTASVIADEPVGIHRTSYS